MADYFTKEGLEKLEKELELLKTVERKKIANAIAEAADKGDLSENAEYDAAKDAQGHLEAKIAKLEDTVANAKVLDKSKMDTSRVTALSTVYLKNHNTGKEVKYTLVSESESNLKEGKISLKSPIGKGLVGKKPGEVIDVKVPAGMLKLEVLKITME